MDARVGTVTPQSGAAQPGLEFCQTFEHFTSLQHLNFDMSLIEALTKTFPSSQVLFPETAEFEAQNSSFLAAQQSDLKPAAIVQPKNKEEVAKFVQQFKPLAKDNACVFAIRGGGQNPLLGCTNVDGPGVTLDLALLNDVEIKDGSVSVGAGARWGDVFDALERTGQGVSGNRSSKAGIGGLALQGQ
jgi:FAD/FMN-containing dehydrogenase